MLLIYSLIVEMQMSDRVRREIGNLTYVTDLQIPFLRRALNRGAQRVVSSSKRNLRSNKSISTGLLRRSIAKEVKVGNREVSAIVGTNVNYAGYVEEGTRPHKIRPSNKRFLRFVIGGKVIFAKEVNHPGSKAKPYLVPALKSNRSLIINDIVVELNKVRYLS